ncbi:MAG: YhcN/YlaJ family sporulation lipoprotein [Clostridia bacterium]|nr:YhcN/YlaJ family sporulation lipoprotein [Clostridia bacterium]
MKKGMMVLLCIAMAGMVLSGCASRSASGTTATAAPIATNSPMATIGQATTAPDMSPDMNAGAAAGTQAGAAVGSMTDDNSTSGTTDTMDNTLMSSRSQAADMSPAEAGRTAEKIEEAVERISEIDDVEVVIGGENRVLVAVEFDDQYSAGLDDRMKDMIAEAVQNVDDSLTDVEITDDDTLYGQVKGLGDRLAKATGLDELADDFGDLWDRITGM